jgi:aminopeptidase N
MWLNEGWASYTERLFDEWLISRATYDAEVRDNHKEMLQLAHVRDSAYWPLSNVPHAYTYSNHTYELPSDKIHTLRSYMGDSLFFAGLRHYLETHLYTHATSNDLRDALQEATELDLNDYFSDWVDTPGWAGFEIDSTTYAGGLLNVYYSQKSAGNTHQYQNVPMSFSFVRSDFSAESSTASLSGPNGMVSFELDFEPKMVILNRDEKISQAVTGQEAVITSTGTRVWGNALVEIPVDAISDSVLLRVEHYWVAPDPIQTPYMPYRLSPNRYWKVDGILNSGFKGSFRVQYNGKTNTTDSGWLDHNLITDENKLVLMYRRNASDDWRVIPSTKTMYTSTTDKFGKIESDSLMLGEYVLAELDSSLGISTLPQKSEISELIITPNPAKDEITVRWNDDDLSCIEIFDVSGRNIGYTQPIRGSHAVTLPVSHLGKGHFMVRRTLSNGKIALGRFVRVE